MCYLPLFPELPESRKVAPGPPVSPAELRLSVPVRNQVEMVMRDLDSSLDPAHPARAIWALVERRWTFPNCMSPYAPLWTPLGVLPRTPRCCCPCGSTPR